MSQHETTEVKAAGEWGRTIFEKAKAAVDARRVSLWRVQEALRGYADAMERGDVPQLAGPDALREAAKVMEHVA